ncbi:MAG TPA: ECF-type sigma factor, partial [Verrucomicrobiae bacterium]|nr:ECF-type sigma factor [Verrucomicrobiae bacterium]
MGDVTQMLNSIPSRDPAEAEQLLPLVYNELRRLAAHKMDQEPSGNTLQPTALVHEAWVRLTSSPGLKWDGRAHFFAAAAEAMRRILIEKVRRKRARRHGGLLERLDIDSIEVEAPVKDDEMLAVDEVLETFARVHPEKA